MESVYKPANLRLYISVFLISMASLLYEILLTRVFSATSFYHFAFISISSAMLGLALGATIVYLNDDLFRPAVTEERMAQLGCMAAYSSILGVLLHINSPYIFGFHELQTNILLAIGISLPIILLTFIAVGAFVCLALTRFPREVAKTYAFDLVGAAVGCVVAVPLSNHFDIFANILIGSVIYILASLIVMPKEKAVVWKAVSTISLVIFLTLTAAQISSIRPIRLTWSKGIPDVGVLYDKWNSLSHIRIYGNPTEDMLVGDPTMSKVIAERRIPQLTLDMDGMASTAMTKFDGNVKSVDFMQHDISTVAHQIRHPADVAIIGLGAGRDLLSATVFGQPSILGIEINPDTIYATTKLFGDFYGHIDKRPGVTVLNDEARSALTRTKKKFDIIQMSLIDTFAASSNGAFALSENSLYTVEAWRTLLEDLTPRGVLTVTRWFARESPSEFYRLADLAVSSLNSLGIADCRQRIIVVRNIPDTKHGVGTILVSKAPFSTEDFDKINKVCLENGFESVYVNGKSLDPILSRLLTPGESAAEIANYPLNIKAPTDDCPFFFQMFKATSWDSLQQNMQANFFSMLGMVLSATSLIVVGLVLWVLFRLTTFTTKNTPMAADVWRHCLYFFFIGAGFMLIELAQIQRLIIFLGHPSYGLTVVLCTLLLACGVGSYACNQLAPLSRRKAIATYAAIVSVLIIFGLSIEPIARSFYAANLFDRIVCTTFLMFPLGVALGFPFPLGMFALAKNPKFGASMWGVNGVASVFGSTLSTILAMSAGLQMTYYIGVAFYILAAATFISNKKLFEQSD